MSMQFEMQAMRMCRLRARPRARSRSTRGHPQRVVLVSKSLDVGRRRARVGTYPRLHLPTPAHRGSPFRVNWGGREPPVAGSSQRSVVRSNL